MKKDMNRVKRVVIVSGDRLEEACGGVVPDRIYRDDAWPEEVWSAVAEAADSLDEAIPEGPWPCDEHVSTGQLGIHDDTHYLLGLITHARCTDGCPGVRELDDDAIYRVACGSVPLCSCQAQTLPTDWRSEPALTAREDAALAIERLTRHDRIIVVLPDESGPADEDLAEWMVQASARGVAVIGLDWERRSSWPIEHWIIDGNPLKRVRETCVKPISRLIRD